MVQTKSYEYYTHRERPYLPLAVQDVSLRILNPRIKTLL